MYVDKDNFGSISMMEMSPFDIYVLTEALTRLSTNPDVSQEQRDKGKSIAIMINNELIKKN